MKPSETFRQPSEQDQSRMFQVQHCKDRSHPQGKVGNAELRRWSLNCHCCLRADIS